MKGCQVGWQEKGEINASIADDGPHEGYDAAYEEDPQKGQQEGGSGKKTGVMEAGVWVVSPGAIDDEDDKGNPDDDTDGHKLQGECQVDVLATHAGERLAKAIEKGIGDDVAQAVPGGLQRRERDPGIAVEEQVLLLSFAQCPWNFVQHSGFEDIQANDEQYKCAQAGEEGDTTHVQLPCQPYRQRG